MLLRIGNTYGGYTTHLSQVQLVTNSTYLSDILFMYEFFRKL